MFEYIPEQKICSLETETFPKLLSRGEFLNSYFENAYWADVGSMTDFERVNDEILSKGESLTEKEEKGKKIEKRSEKRSSTNKMRDDRRNA